MFYKQFLYLILLVPQIAWGQIDSKPLSDDDYKIIKLGNTQPASPLLKFSNVFLSDIRDDTTNLGYEYRDQKHRGTRYTVGSLASGVLRSWYASYLKSGSTDPTAYNLHIYLKKFRAAKNMKVQNRRTDDELIDKNEIKNGIIFKAEFYCEKGNVFFPLYRFDSLIIFEDFYKDPSDCFTSCLKIAVLKMLTIDTAAISSKRKLTNTDILQYNKREYAILSMDVLKKGIYMNLNEFRNNAPAILDYEFGKGKLADRIYGIENGSKNPIWQSWGYCDGTNSYIKSGSKYSKLVRSGNTFYFEGIKNVTIKNKIYWPGAALTTLGIVANTKADIQGRYNSSPYDDYRNDRYSNRIEYFDISKKEYTVQLRYYQLDMENGNIY